jgi:ubiquinone/menaquinone biosynthesis C-methylase UbiE
VQDAWAGTELPPNNWWDIPEVNSRWNSLISGRKNVEYYEYIAKKYFGNRRNLVGLSLGCGTGHRELKWVGLKKFKAIEAVDISGPRIEMATTEARARGYDNIISYKVADVYKMPMSESHYDAIFAEGSLHHFSPLKVLLQRINTSLKSEGYFIINEFVGPTRFQWTERQIEVINSLLSILPAKYKKLWKSSNTKSNIIRPSKLRMILEDPSEAVESSNILPVVSQIFDVVEVRPYGGTILHMLLSGIGHNFVSSEQEVQKWLNILFEVEDLLLFEKELNNDFVVAVCRKRQN